jgi:hypothetical protein
MTTNHSEILLVEDDHEDVDVPLRALSNEPVANHVHVARDGEEAHCDAGYPKLILLGYFWLLVNRSLRRTAFGGDISNAWPTP